MSLIKEARDSGYETCMKDFGIEKSAFIGAVIKGAWGGAKAIGQKLGLTGSREIRKAPAMSNIPKHNPKLIGPQVLQNRKQFVQNGKIRQKGVINGMHAGEKSMLGVGALGYGGSKVLDYGNRQANQGKHILRRPRTQSPGSAYAYRR